MRTRLKLSKLKTVLPAEMIEALETGGFFNASGTDGDEPEILRKGVLADARELEEGERAVVQYVSTRTVDRDREVLVPEGAILDQFLKAPQVLWGHDYSMPPIGKAEWVKADKNGLKAKTVFAETETAEEVWQLVKGGFLKTASVGFMPLERVWKGEQRWRETCDKLNRKWGCDLEREGAEIITTKWVVLEYSMVPVPANIDALVTAVAKGGLALSDELREQLGVDNRSEPEPTPEEPRRLVVPITNVTPKRDTRFVQVLKSPTVENHRRLVSVINETLDCMRGRL